MKIKSIKKVDPRKVYAVQTSTETFIADGLAHHNCYHCNCRKQGAWPEYYTFMEKTYGQEVIDELMSMRNDVVPMSATDHLEKEAYFKEKLAQLNKEKENETVLGY